MGPKTEDLYRKLPCLVCGASASGIHFGAVTCEACKVSELRMQGSSVERRDRLIRSRASSVDRSRRTLRNATIAPRTIIVKSSRRRRSRVDRADFRNVYKLECRWMVSEPSFSFHSHKLNGASLSFSHWPTIQSLQRKVGDTHSTETNERQHSFSPLSNECYSIRQLQNGSTSMATINDSARIASMAKRRKTKTKTGRGRAKFDQLVTFNISSLSKCLRRPMKLTLNFHRRSNNSLINFTAPT